MSFSDLQQLVKDKDGNEIPYGVALYKRLVDECYCITRNVNTSYMDAINLSIREKDIFLEMIEEENRRNNEFIEKQNSKLKK